MPVYYINKLTIECTLTEATEIWHFITNDDDNIDFNELIPTPIYVHRSINSSENDFIDFDDFCAENWRQKYWGTKSNAYNSNFEYVNDNKCIITFNTDWSVPYPIIIAFANKIDFDFTHEYTDKEKTIGGVDVWKDKIRVSSEKFVI